MSKTFKLMPIVNFFCFFTGIVSCLSFQKILGLSNVLSAVLTGLIASFIHPLINRPKSARKPPPRALRGLNFEFLYFESLVFIGAFVAMDIRSNNYSQQIIAWPLILQALFGYLLFLILKKHFSGIGGRLGLMAFIISLTSLLCKFAMDNFL